MTRLLDVDASFINTMRAERNGKAQSAISLQQSSIQLRSANSQQLQVSHHVQTPILLGSKQL